MIRFISQLLGPSEPAIREADARDAQNFAILHATCFARGWSEDEFARLLVEQNIVAHRATIAKIVAGFVLSRHAADEAEILSIAVAAARRNHGIAGRILDLHLRRLAGIGIRSVLLEVKEDNEAARRLYARTGFTEIGRREGYYQRAGTSPASALILRRSLA